MAPKGNPPKGNPQPPTKRKAGSDLVARAYKKPTPAQTFARRQAYESQDLQSQLDTFKQSPHGRDHPQKLDKWLKATAAKLVYSPAKTAADPDPKPMVISCTARKVVHSNTPGYSFRSNSYAWQIRADNIKSTKGAPISSEHIYQRDVDAAALVAGFAGWQDTPNLSTEDAEDLKAFGEPLPIPEGQQPPPAKGRDLYGIHCLSWQIKELVFFDAKPPAGEEDAKIEEFMDMMNERPGVFTVVQRNARVRLILEKYWQTVSEKAVLRGVWHEYKDVTKNRVNKLFEQWEESPNVELKHQIWMQKIALRRDLNKTAKFASHTLKKAFGSLREMEVTECVALIYELMWENVCAKSYFSIQRAHKAEVIMNHEGYIQLDVTVTRRDDGLVIPSCPEDTRFEVRMGNPAKPTLGKFIAGATPVVPEAGNETPMEGVEQAKSNEPSTDNAVPQVAENIVKETQPVKPPEVVIPAEERDAEMGGTENVPVTSTKADAGKLNTESHFDGADIEINLDAREEEYVTLEGGQEPPKDANKEVTPASGSQQPPVHSNESIYHSRLEDMDDDAIEFDAYTVDYAVAPIPALPVKIKFPPKAHDKARVINTEKLNGDFIISFTPKTWSSLGKWIVGETVDISLVMERNNLPAQRQLKAVAKICAKTKKNSTATYLQHVLRGAGNPIIKGNTIKAEIEKIQRQDLLDRLSLFLDTVKLDDSQKAIFDSILEKSHVVTQLQGPPGTGKTMTTATLAFAFALLDLRTALCAPSNIAIQALLRETLKLVDMLEVVGVGKGDFRVVYVPSLATLKGSFGNLSSEHDVADFMAEAKIDREQPWSEIALHSWIVRYFQEKAQKNPDDRFTSGWLEAYDRLMEGNMLGKEESKLFTDAALGMAQEIFRDQRVKLVISTSSNARIVSDHGFQPRGCIIDESAFDTEQGTLVPLSLMARFNVLVGDHWQLKPLVRSREHNEFANQLGLSMFERLYGHWNIPVFRLKVNYRMHPDVAKLPGMLTYEWLGCHPTTEVESDAFQFFKNWWDTKGSANYNQIVTEYGGVHDPSCRVRWVDTYAGFGSTVEGSRSLRNFANINATSDIIVGLAKTLLDNNYVGSKLDLSKITVLSPYKDDISAFEKQLRLRLDAVAFEQTDQCWPVTSFPQCHTIDKLQGSESDIVLFLVPQHHPNQFGFMTSWNRWNVALTRANSVCWVIGNLTGLRKYLRVIVSGLKAKKFGLMMMDFISKGRIIEPLCGQTIIDTKSRYLPANWDEVDPAAGASESTNWNINVWSNEQIPNIDSRCKLAQKHQIIHDGYEGEARTQYELKLMQEVAAMRARWAELQRKHDAGEEFETARALEVQGEGSQDNEQQEEPQSEADPIDIDEGADVEISQAGGDTENLLGSMSALQVSGSSRPSAEGKGKGKSRDIE